MEIGKKFIDIEKYNNEMTKSMKDKLFFIDKLSPSDQYIFVDFGCADGSMIKELVKIYGRIGTYIGYDCSDTMISYAKTIFNKEDNLINVVFTTNWDEVLKNIGYWRSPGTKVVLILSSVIHEVYSYGNQSDIDSFWNKVWCSYKPRDKYGFDYVVVRDMMISKSAIRDTTIDVSSIRNNLSIKPLLDDFENKWGGIHQNKNLLHFLLKYRYTINWEREVSENYFPITIEKFIDMFDGFFRLDYFEKFRVRYIEEKIYEDFGIVLEDTTHIKAIFIANA